MNSRSQRPGLIWMLGYGWKKLKCKFEYYETDYKSRAIHRPSEFILSNQGMEGNRLGLVI